MSMIDFRLDPALGDDALASDWQRLAGQTDSGPFLSWPWIDAWLNTLADRPLALRAYQGPDLVAIALLARTSQWRRGGFRARSLHLNHCGSPRLDQIWPEYNGFLAKPESEPEVYAQCLEYLSAELPGWDEFCTGVMRGERVTALKAERAWIEHTVWEAPTYSVDLKALAGANRAYLDGLSRGTRYQIRHSQRRLEAMGDLTLEVVQEPGPVRERFHLLGEWHKKDWNRDSGFHNPEFIRFHEALIQSQYPQQLPRVYLLKLGDRPIAGLYNLRYQGREYFYLGFADRRLPGRIRPGLVLHARVIQRALDEGFVEYDFMGGDMQYKRQLSRCTGQLASVRLKRPSLKYRTEHRLRRLKQLWLPKALS